MYELKFVYLCMCLTPYISINPNYFKQRPFVSAVYANGVRIEDCSLSSNYHYLRTFSGLDSLDYDDNGYCITDPVVRNDLLSKSYFTIQGKLFPLFLEFPCGRCKHCGFDSRRQYEYRSCIEAADFPNTYFMTLTYDDEHLPRYGLCKCHVQLFLKTLRNRLTQLSRMRGVEPLDFHCIYCGEYGADKRFTQRPHYHFLIYFHRALKWYETRDIKLLLCRKHPIFDYGKFTKEDDSYRRAARYASRTGCSLNTLGRFSYRYLWLFGSVFDFCPCRNPIASSRYIMKYITKQKIAFSASDREEFDYYKEPMFVQTPRQRAIGTLNPERWYDAVVSKSETIDLQCPGFDKSGRAIICRSKIPIPRIIYEKLFPSVGRFVPNFAAKCQAFNIVLDYLTDYRDRLQATLLDFGDVEDSIALQQLTNLHIFAEARDKCKYFLSGVRFSSKTQRRFDCFAAFLDYYSISELKDLCSLLDTLILDNLPTIFEFNEYQLFRASLKPRSDVPFATEYYNKCCQLSNDFDKIVRTSKLFDEKIVF